MPSRLCVNESKPHPHLGTWAFPGGHLEYGETFDACAKREVLEETGLLVVRTQFLAATNDFMPSEGKHYVTVFMGCVIEGQNKEPVVSSLCFLGADFGEVDGIDTVCHELYTRG